MSVRPGRRMRVGLTARLAAFVASAFVVLAVLFVAVARHQQDVVLDEATEQVRRQAMLVGTGEERLLEGARQLLASVSRTDRILGPGCATYLRAVVPENPWVLNLGVIDPAGEVVCSALFPIDAVDLGGRRFFREVVAGAPFAVGDYVASPASPTRVLRVGYPIRLGGSLLGVAFATLSPAWVEATVGEVGLHPDARVLVVDRSGLVIVQSPDPEGLTGTDQSGSPVVARALAGASDHLHADGPGGVDRLWGFVPLGDHAHPSAVLLVGVPTSEAVAPLQRSLDRWLGVIALVAAVTVAVGALAGARWVVRPLRRLVQASDRLARGEVDVRVDEGPGAPEIHQAAAAFNAMAERLSSIQSGLRRAALHDPLTGLANRALLVERVRQTQREWQRTKERAVLLFIDLDRFKPVNDALGHDAGDAVLAALGRRFERLVRPGDTVARIGGDEFVVLLTGLGGHGSELVGHALRVADRLVDVAHEPVFVDQVEVSVGASVGLTVAGPHDDVELLLRQADVAMYEAKRQGGGACVVFDDALRLRAVDPLDMGAGLRRALVHDEIVVLYQPVVDLTDGRVVAVEALVRWDHPTRGLLTPATFLEPAAHVGGVVPIGERVLELACEEAGAWMAAGHRIRLHVNVSPHELGEAWERHLDGVLAGTGVPASLLSIELTETAIVNLAGHSVAQLVALRRRGIDVGIDDFGTGYASLAWLTDLPVSFVKIDRSFTAAIASPRPMAVVRGIVAMTAEIGCGVVVEGVETAGQERRLRELGCRLAQGYRYGRPQTGAELRALLDGERQVAPALSRPDAGET